MTLFTLLVHGGLTACQDDTGIRATLAMASATATIPVGLESFYNQKVSWCACDKKGMDEATSGKGTGFTCAKVKMPLDYDNPGSKMVEIAVKRRAAGEDSIDSLSVNPGGSRGSGTESVGNAGSYFSKSLINPYDVTGFGPRGVGASTAADCLTNAGLDAEWAGADDPATPSVAATQERAQKMGEACTSKTSPAGFLDHIDTISAAKNSGVPRAVNGQQALTYLGFPYGTYLRVAYAELLPANTGRLVLDGAVDPSLSTVDLALGQAKGFEASLRAYAQNCQSSKLGCPLNGDVNSGVSQVRESLESTKAAPLLTPDDKRPSTYDLTVYGVLGSACQTQLRPPLTLVLSQAMDRARTPDGSALLAIASAVSSRQSNGSYSGNNAETLMAVNYLDYLVQRDNTSWEEEVKTVNEVPPTFDSQLLYPNTYCQSWGRTSSRKREKITASDAASVLVVGAIDDLATPYAWLEAPAGQLESGQLMTRKGNGHIVYGRSNDCVREVVDTYLFSGTMPAKGFAC